MKKDIKKIPEGLGHRGFFNWMNDELYLKMIFRFRMGKRLNLENPQTFNEKLQWLKLHDRNPLYTQLVDKYEVRKYVTKKIGKEYLIPLLGVWDSLEDINFDSLPEQFVLKCTHDSGGLVICRDKSKFDVKATRRRINRCLKHNYFWGQREWPYRIIKPRIIAEEYMTEENEAELKDYKFFCFDGIPRDLFVATDRSVKGKETKFDFFDMDFCHLPFTNGHENSKKEIKCPASFEEMKKIAAELSRDMMHVRIDLYDIKGKIYFGEITFFHWSGFVPFNPKKWDNYFGDWLKLPI